MVDKTKDNKQKKKFLKYMLVDDLELAKEGISTKVKKLEEIDGQLELFRKSIDTNKYFESKGLEFVLNGLQKSLSCDISATSAPLFSKIIEQKIISLATDYAYGKIRKDVLELCEQNKNVNLLKIKNGHFYIYPQGDQIVLYPQGSRFFYTNEKEQSKVFKPVHKKNHHDSLLKALDTEREILFNTLMGSLKSDTHLDLSQDTFTFFYKHHEETRLQVFFSKKGDMKQAILALHDLEAAIAPGLEKINRVSPLKQFSLLDLKAVVDYLQASDIDFPNTKDFLELINQYNEMRATLEVHLQNKEAVETYLKEWHRCNQPLSLALVKAYAKLKGFDFCVYEPVENANLPLLQQNSYLSYEAKNAPRTVNIIKRKHSFLVLMIVEVSPLKLWVEYVELLQNKIIMSLPSINLQKTQQDCLDFISNTLANINLPSSALTVYSEELAKGRALLEGKAKVHALVKKREKQLEALTRIMPQTINDLEKSGILHQVMTVHEPLKFGKTLLMMAVEEKNAELSDFLIKRGASVTALSELCVTVAINKATPEGMALVLRKNQNTWELEYFDEKHISSPIAITEVPGLSSLIEEQNLSQKIFEERATSLLRRSTMFKKYFLNIVDQSLLYIKLEC
jgi:hypothetical protein